MTQSKSHTLSPTWLRETKIIELILPDRTAVGQEDSAKENQQACIVLIQLDVLLNHLIRAKQEINSLEKVLVRKIRVF